MARSSRRFFGLTPAARLRRWRSDGFFRPIGEALEPRTLLAAVSSTNAYDTVAPDWFAQVPRGLQDQSSRSFIGPLAAAVGSSGGNWQSSADVAQWIVRLTPDATKKAGSVAGAEAVLSSDGITFQVLKGLGLPGEVLVESTASSEQVGAALSDDPDVASFEPNAYFAIQDLPPRQPGDPDYSSMTNLNNVGQFGARTGADIDAPEAWNETVGSTNVVVGVIDSGIDYTHPDLYLNVWINQGEIPAALKQSLVDTDGDKRITFYDLNDAQNSALVSNLNGDACVVAGHPCIDAGDLLADPRWTDGDDTDGNSFIDDLVGWNFRSAGDEPFAVNDPQDALGHGSHVAGTIGAIGDNGAGITGINWRSSLMALKFLDTSNSGQTADAVAAINYATLMRTEFHEPVKVLNASFGQAGSESQALRDAIDASGQADMLFVAAAGNGDVLGQGINLDKNPFFPASSALPNVISVAASGPNDEFARFSNFGATSVDLAAPGIGVLSTLPGGRYGTENGTSMAAPHVAGAAALIWSLLPDASLSEVRQAILTSVDHPPAFGGVTATGGRLNVKEALDSNVFAPRASLVNVLNPTVTVGGGADNRVTVKFHHRLGIATATIGDGDIIATRRWGNTDTIVATYVPNSLVVSPDGTDTTATYSIAAPGGAWDPLDFGDYEINVVDYQVSNTGGLFAPAEKIGSFLVRVNDPTVFYVNSFADGIDTIVGDGQCLTGNGDCTLRAAIEEANAAAPAPRTIILDQGTFGLSIPPVVETTSSFTAPAADSGCFQGNTTFISSDITSGDLDVTSQIAIIGNQNSLTTIDAAGLDRVFKIHGSSSLTLSRLTVTGGSAAQGGGILSNGSLHLDMATVAGNSATDGGGGVALWNDSATIDRTTLSGNQASRGGAVLVCNGASADIVASTLNNNIATNSGGAIQSAAGASVNVTNSTIAANTGGAIAGNPLGFGFSQSPSLSADGRFIAFRSSEAALVPGDNNGNSNVFVFDRLLKTVERDSVSSSGVVANADCGPPSISADGSAVAFSSYASNLVEGDNNFQPDIFVFDRSARKIERISVADNGVEGNGASTSPWISGDGRYVAYSSYASNLTPGATNGSVNVYVYDRLSRTTERITVGFDGSPANGYGESLSLSFDGRYVAFESSASNLVPEPYPNGTTHIYVYDRQQHQMERISVNAGGLQGNGFTRFPSISGDGQLVVFQSDAGNLVANDTNFSTDIFVYDREQKKIERVSVADGGAEGNSASTNPSVSPDGRYVSFASKATNLVAGDTNGFSDVFIYDRTQQHMVRASVTSQGAEGDDDSGIVYRAAFSGDGRVIAFVSRASNFVAGDVFHDEDVYYADRQDGQLASVMTRPGAPIVLEHVTVAGNQGIPNVSGNVQTHNSLFVNNSPLIGEFVSAGYNLIDRVVAVPTAPTDQFIGTAGIFLGPLQDNGGLTKTLALLSGSPAIDAAEPAASAPVDQRGVQRSQDGDGVLGSQPDIGAFEAYRAAIRGTIFLDRNTNGTQDNSESGRASQVVYLDSNRNGQFDAGELTTSTLADNPQTGANEAGNFAFAELAPADYWVAPLVGATWSQTPRPTFDRVSVSSDGLESNSYSVQTSISQDGRFVAFTSDASNLVPGDTNQAFDIFVYDRQSRRIERVSVSSTGIEGDNVSYGPTISADGRYVIFNSQASNLVPGDTNNGSDIFLFDRQTRHIERVNVTASGQQSNRPTEGGAVSADGRYVAFTSGASDLVDGDTNDEPDVFVVDRQIHSIERVNVADDGSQALGDFSYFASISADGRYVGFVSYAANLVPNDTNGIFDMFVYDRLLRHVERVSVADDGSENESDVNDTAGVISPDGHYAVFSAIASNLVPDDTNGQTDVFLRDLVHHTTERVSIGNDGSQGNNGSYAPSISRDGEFISFVSSASNLVPGDTNFDSDVFVYNRSMRELTRVSVADNGKEAGATIAAISGDGRFVAMVSYYENLVDNDRNGTQDIFVAINRSAPAPDSASVSLYAGQVVSNVDFGIVPDPGTISGTCFDDVITDGIRNPAEPAHFDEPGHVGCTVFIDANANGRFDLGEKKATTDANGAYVFNNLDSEADYQIGVVVPNLQTLVLPTTQNNGVWKVHLPAGGNIADRDFGFRPASTTGQSQNSTISGRLFIDQPGGTKPPVSDVSVYLDTHNFGVRDNDERRVTPNADGTFSFTGLGNQSYTVRVTDNVHLNPLTPIGNIFTKDSSKFSATGSPTDVVVGDFDADTWPDIALAILNENNVVIFLNDRLGGFAAAKVVSVSPLGSGPYSLLAGNFDGQGGDDLAVANSYSSNVAILLNFNGTTFASRDSVNVVSIPVGLARDPGQGLVKFLLVTNDIENATGDVKNISILRNDDHGKFTALDTDQLSAGNLPQSIAVGYFNDDALADFAVADFGIQDDRSAKADAGDLRVFLAQPGSGYQSSIACSVGYGPASVVTADLDGDQKLDLAVANFLTNNISVCRGNGDGTFTNVATLSGGGGPFDLDVADIDNDGDSDLLVGDGKSQNFGVLRNKSTAGSFNFDPIETSGVGLIPNVAGVNVAVGDFSHQNKLDLAIANSDPSKDGLTIFRNKIVGGARRLALDGVQAMSGIDFAFARVNLPPTLNAIPTPPSVNEDSLPITINLSGITAGLDENQPLEISVTTNNPALIVSSAPQYQSSATTGTIQLTLAPNQSGQATITVKVTDGGLDGDIFTTADNASVQQTFTFTVNPLNDLPTLDPIPTLLLVGQNPVNQTFNLTGITAGGGESQPLSVAATTDNPQLIQNLTIDYSSGNSTATVHFATSQAAPNVNGQIVFTVTDGGLDNNLATAGDNLSTSRSIVILVISGAVINHVPTFTKGPDPQNITDESKLVSLVNWATGISPGNDDSVLQTVHFIVSSDNASLFAVQPAVDLSGKLTFTTKPNQIGVAHVSVVAKDDGGTASGGSDQSDPQVFIIEIKKARVWHNADVNADVNADKSVAADDVVAIINYINAAKPELVPADGRATGPFYDVTGDGHIAADDVLAVINYVNAHPAVKTTSLASSAVLIDTEDSRPFSQQGLSAELLDLLATELAGQPKRKL